MNTTGCDYDHLFILPSEISINISLNISHSLSLFLSSLSVHFILHSPLYLLTSLFPSRSLSLRSLSPRYLFSSLPLSSLLSLSSRLLSILSSPGIAYRSVTRRSRAPWRHPCPRNSPPWGGNACKTRLVLNGLYACNWITFFKWIKWFILVYVV